VPQPSGSEKSTLIRCINRPEAHDKGEIVLHGTVLKDDSQRSVALRRAPNTRVSMDHGRLVDHAPPEACFGSPQSERARLVLSRILAL
jgi:ABC-type polar amino acid transport system ATPase subunit